MKRKCVFLFKWLSLSCNARRLSLQKWEKADRIVYFLVQIHNNGRCFADKYLWLSGFIVHIIFAMMSGSRIRNRHQKVSAFICAVEASLKTITDVTPHNGHHPIPLIDRIDSKTKFRAEIPVQFLKRFPLSQFWKVNYHFCKNSTILCWNFQLLLMKYLWRTAKKCLWNFFGPQSISVAYRKTNPNGARKINTIRHF